MKDRLREFIGLIFRWPARLLVRFWFGVRVSADPSIGNLKGKVIVCNHPSVLDPPLLYGLFPLGTWFTGTQKVMLRYKVLNAMRILPVLFFPASGLRKQDMVRMNQIAGRGRNLVIFPQADTVHPDGEFACYPGFWRVARRAEKEIVYVAVDGTHRVFDWENDRQIKRGQTVCVNVFGRLPSTCTEDAAIGLFRAMIESLRTKP